jgi:hypothetical protein
MVLFALMGFCVLLVVWTDERFWLNPADPHWKHVAPVKWLLMLHGLAGVTALMAGAFQMSSRIRRPAPAFHRALGKVYIWRSASPRRSPLTWAPARSSPSASVSSRYFQGGCGCSAR